MNTIIMLFSRVFIFMLLGYILGRFSRANIQQPVQVMINLVLYFLFPVFVLFTVWSEPLESLLLFQVAAVATGVIVFGLALAWLFVRVYKLPYRDYSLPIIFINSAYLAIPVNTYILGSTATAYAIIFDIVPTMAMFTVGVALVSRENKIKEIFKMPLVYAAIIGLVLNYQQVSIALPVLKMIIYIKHITMSLILFIVGYELRPFTAILLKKVLIASLLRMVGGLIAAFLLVHWLNLTGLPAMVCLISASMPSAVNSYFLAKKYQANAEFTSAVVAMSTLISLPFIALGAVIPK